MEAYITYCEWARAHGKATLTREQWEQWCLALDEQRARDYRFEPRYTDREIERAQREDWSWR